MDAYANNVVLLMHMDGADNGTVFVDEKGKLATAGGNARTSTDQSVFGGSSAYFDGSGDFISIPNSADFNFGTGDFTIEWWMRCEIDWTSMTNQGVLGQKTHDGTNGWQIYRNNVNSPTQVNIRITADHDFASGATPTTGVWEHWAVSRSTGTLRWFKNGVLTATHTCTYNISDSGTFYCGYTNTWGGFFRGHIDEVRITKGVARYTSNFTVSSTAFDLTLALVSGTVKTAAGVPVSRSIRVHRRDTGALVGSGQSRSTDGAYTVELTFAGGEVQVIMMDNASGSVENDQILRAMV